MLTQAHLERRLWAAAEALRGVIDASDYRAYILGAIVLKRVSDVADEDPAAAITVPPAARWSQLVATPRARGAALARACAALERANPALAGMLTTIGFDSAHRLGPLAQRDRVLGGLLAALDPLPLGNAALGEPDVLGRAYEYLIARFADDAGRKGGEFYTPRTVVQLLVAILAPRAGMRVCDPTCGSAGMLVEVAARARARGEDPRAITLHGQERSRATWSIARMNLLLHGLPEARIEHGDTLRAPKLLRDHALERYDRVIANPPFSLDDWGRDEAAADRFARFAYGLPARSRGDLAFVQHIVATLADEGLAAVVLPQGALVRGGAEAAIRAGLLRDGRVRAAIALPPHLFHGTPIPTAVLVLGRGCDRVRCIDASRACAQGMRQNHLRESDIESIVAAFGTDDTVAGFARTVPVEAVLRARAALSAARWVAGEGSAPGDDLTTALASLSVSARTRDEAEAAMHAALATVPLSECRPRDSGPGGPPSVACAHLPR